MLWSSARASPRRISISFALSLCAMWCRCDIIVDCKFRCPCWRWTQQERESETLSESDLRPVSKLEAAYKQPAGQPASCMPELPLWRHYLLLALSLSFSVCFSRSLSYTVSLSLLLLYAFSQRPHRAQNTSDLWGERGRGRGRGWTGVDEACGRSWINKWQICNSNPKINVVATNGLFVFLFNFYVSLLFFCFSLLLLFFSILFCAAGKTDGKTVTRLDWRWFGNWKWIQRTRNYLLIMRERG